MKWYFCTNGSGAHRYKSCIMAAVQSCRDRTTLQPVYVCYDADRSLPPDLVAFLARHDVPLIRRRPLILDHIAGLTETVPDYSLDIAAGTYLRFDVPFLETEDDFVLYTDCDVMFLNSIDLASCRPRFFACAPEFEVDNWTYCNAGVMVMNVEAMRRTSADLCQLSVARLKAGMTQSYDQSDLNAFYHGAWDRLSPLLNWKPYWGVDPAAKILHFHGPKPDHIRRQLKGDRTVPILDNLYARNPTAYRDYFRLFVGTLARANRDRRDPLQSRADMVAPV